MVDTPDGPAPLYDWLARRLAQKLGVEASLLPTPPTLDAVVGAYMANRGRREEAYVRLRAILRDTPLAPPLALRQLAAIRDFDLFVTTTFDPLLAQALADVRGPGAVEVLSYAPNRVVDLPAGGMPPGQAIVYHLFGRVSASPTYVVTDEDILESMCALQSEHLTPERLFHELETHHLLFIGGHLGNWLVRLFLRMTKRHRLSDPRDVGEVLADDRSVRDERLVRFLQQVSTRTRLFDGAHAFVDELHRRWLARSAPPLATSAPARFLPPAREMPERAIFISYAREDLAAVQRLKSELEDVGLVPWFDLEQLEAGDDFDRKIRRNIARCSYFVPVISAATERRHEAWFRREWSYALDRTRNMADGALFVLPIVIDDTDAGRAIVPEAFRSLHVSRLPGGALTPAFAARLRELSATPPR